jgi:hypothetical protein
MKAMTKVLAGGAAAAALACAAPAAAQYYPGQPGYGYPGQQGYPGYPGGGYGNYGGYGQQQLVNQCMAAVQQRLSGTGYGGYGYNGYNNQYGRGGYGGARVLGVSRVEPRLSGGFTVHGVASSGRYGAYGYGGYGNGGYGNGGEQQVDLTWRCKTDYRGFVTDIDVNRAQPAYGYDRQPYDNNYNYDYSQYGYRRY